jgi:O-antigen/teichoic acid export membrane protein
MTIDVQPRQSSVPDLDELKSRPPIRDDRASAGGRIVRNTIALGLARPLTWLSAIGLTVLLPRYLGDANLGKINLAFAFADWAGLIASFGIGTYVAKEVARRGQAANSLVLNAVLLRLALALGIGALTGVFVTFLGLEDLTRHLVYLLTIHMLLTVIAGVLVSSLQGMQDLRSVAIVDALSKLAQLGLVGLVLAQGYGPIAVALAYIASDILAIIWYLFAVSRRINLSGPIALVSWKNLLAGGLPFLVWETALLTYARVDVIILSIFASDAVLGWYAAAYRIISIPLIAPAILMTAVFPALSASGNNRSSFSTIAKKSVQATALITVPMALGLAVLADKIIELLGYPIEFTNSIVPLIYLTISLPIVGINMMVGSMLNAVDRQRQWAIAGVAAAVLNVGLNFVAIPYTQKNMGNGAIGAAAVTSLTEVFLFIAGQVLLPRDILNKSTYIGILKCLSVGLVMASAVWLGRDLPIFVAVLLGALTYGAGSLALGTVTVADLKRVRGYLIERR